jgi:hypothetical protein
LELVIWIVRIREVSHGLVCASRLLFEGPNSHRFFFFFFFGLLSFSLSHHLSKSLAILPKGVSLTRLSDVVRFDLVQKLLRSTLESTEKAAKRITPSAAAISPDCSINTPSTGNFFIICGRQQLLYG